MKLLSLLLLASISFLGTAQEINVAINGNIFNVDGDSIFISQFLGDRYEDHAGTIMNEDGTFKFETTLPQADYYVLRFDNSHLNLILRDGANIQVYGDGKKISQFANIIGSDESTKINEFLRLEQNWKYTVDTANLAVQNDPSKRQEMNQMLQGEYRKFQGQVQSFVGQNQNSPALLPVLGAIDPNQDFKGYESVIKQLMVGFSASPTVQKIYKEYQEVKAKMLAANPLAPGKIAPDFTEVTPSGDSLTLSDLRGSVVLIDFWASWCRPCRAENPNVVKAYNKYKEDGFTVMSVSLDKSKTNWEAAIEKDGLIWPNHVSDLKQWSSRVGKLYGVGSIPFTVLIDAEGKVIGTNIRGAALEAELSRIFGH